MTDHLQDIQDIDLMAYADGLLDGDILRKGEVEAYLAQHPEAERHVRAIIEDNRLIRELYARELSRPVPSSMVQHLRQGRDGDRQHRRFASPVGLAASLVLAVLAAGGGWFVGQQSQTPVPQELLGAIAKVSGAVAPEMAALHNGASIAPASAVMGATSAPKSESVLIDVPVPDLAAEGFQLADRSVMKVGDQTMERLVYQGSGETLHLFMRLRHTAKITAMRDYEANGSAVHYWSDGALAYALTINGDDGRKTALAQMVRKAVQPGHFVSEAPKSATETDDMPKHIPLLTPLSAPKLRPSVDRMPDNVQSGSDGLGGRGTTGYVEQSVDDPQGRSLNALEEAVPTSALPVSGAVSGGRFN